MKISRLGRFCASFAAAAALTMATGSFATAQTAGQDMHNAGTSTKNAAKDAGSGVKKGTTKGYDKTKQGATTAGRDTRNTAVRGYDKTKQGTKTAARKTKRETAKGYGKTKDGAERATGSK